MPHNPEQISEFICKLETHPGYQNDPAVRNIIDHYRDRLLDSGMMNVELTNNDLPVPADREINKIFADLKYSLQEYNTYELDSIEALFPGLHLRKQYRQQLDAALASGIFERESGVQNFGNGNDFMCEFPYIDRFDQHYRMPGWAKVKEILLNNRELVQQKSSQGFTKLLIVPFGYDLQTLASHFTGIVRRIDKENGIYDLKGNKISFHEGSPHTSDEKCNENTIIYHPEIYDQKKHGGITKENAIKIDGAWQVCLMEDMPLIPCGNPDQSPDIIGERPRMDISGDFLKCHINQPDPNNKTIEYLNEFINTQGKKLDSPYFAERGITPEIYFWLILSGLLNHEKAVLWDILDSHKGFGTSKVCFTESYFLPSMQIPGLDSFSAVGGRVYRMDTYGQESSLGISTRTRVLLK